MGKNAEISLRQHLMNLGWEQRYLDKTGHFARIGLRNWSSCFEPCGRLQRLLTRKRLPISEIIIPGARIKFLKSLQHEIVGYGPMYSYFGIFVRIMSFFSGHDLSKQPMFAGLIEEHYRFDEFPFDEWLTISLVDDFDALYIAPDNRSWKISHTALTRVTQIEIGT